jgi:hypothetical protein
LRFNASDGCPDASRATLSGISFSITSASGATARTFVMTTARRRGVPYGAAALAASR